MVTITNDSEVSVTNTEAVIRGGVDAMVVVGATGGWLLLLP